MQTNMWEGTLNYPAYYWIIDAFGSTSGSISRLVQGISTMLTDCADTTLLGSFVENHDNVRFPNRTSDISLAKNAIAYSILADGIPIIYQGQEQHYSGGAVPTNREPLWTSGYSTTSTLYTFIGIINAVRNEAIYVNAGYVTYNAAVIYSDDHTIATRKGTTGYQIVSVFSNLGEDGASSTLNIPDTGYAAGTEITDVLTCESLTVDGSGGIAVPMSGGLPRVYFPTSLLSGSMLCGTSVSSYSLANLKTN